MCFFASSTPLRMDSGTSPALPRPTPTWPLPSPTTMTAEKLKRRPPLWTLATRLIWTTRSSSASLFGIDAGHRRLLEVEAGLAGRLGERANPPVVLEARPIEHHLVRRPPSWRARRRAGRRAWRRRSSCRWRRGGRSRATRRRRACAAAGVVDDLGVDVREAAEHGETRTRLGAREPQAEPLVALDARGRAAGGDLLHRLLLPADLAGLARLATDLLAGVPDALALVRLGLAGGADVGRDLPDQLLVDARPPPAGAGSRARS